MDLFVSSFNQSQKMIRCSFKSILIIPILSLILLIHSTSGNECIDTVGWNDRINNFTCLDYVNRGWCVNRTVITALQNNSMASLNFPDLNCCQCGKRQSLKLSSTAQWAEDGITVAGSADGANGSSLDRLTLNYGVFCTDDDILYIADSHNDRIVLIAPNSTTAIRVIGNQSQSNMFTFTGPSDVFATRTSIYVMDTWDFRVQKWTRNFSNPVTMAGISGMNGSSTDMDKLSDAYNLFVDNYGNLFVGDYSNHRVMMFPWNSTGGTNGIIVAGTGVGGAQPNQLNGPSGIFVTDDGTLYIADTGNHRIQKWIVDENSGVTVAGGEGDGNALSQLYYPYTVLVDLDGCMYISDYQNHRIIRWKPGAAEGECIAACSGSEGVNSNKLNGPTSIAFDSSGSLYVNDQLNHRVQKFKLLPENVQSTSSSPSTTVVKTTSSTTGRTTTSMITTARSTSPTSQSTTSSIRISSTTTKAPSKGVLIKAQLILLSMIYLCLQILV